MGGETKILGTNHWPEASISRSPKRYKFIINQGNKLSMCTTVEDGIETSLHNLII